jgi:hypothetical protein
VRWTERLELCGIRDLHRVCWLGDAKERGYVEDMDANGRIVFKLILNLLNTKTNLY